MMARFRPILAWVAIPALSLSVAAAMVAGGGLLVYGSASALPAIARGKVVMAEPETLSVGELQAGRRDQAAFVLTNLTARPIVVNGMRATCTCVSADPLPMEIPPRARRPLRLWVRPPEGQAGKPFSQTVDLYLSVPGPGVPLTVLGTVAKQTAPP